MSEAVLVALTRGGHTIAITRDASGVRLDGTRIGPAERASATFPDGTWVVGGLLPAGAERAVVRDVTGTERQATCGGGAWLAVSERLSAVRFEAADGRVVASAPATADWVAVEDAATPCPACDAIAWVSAGKRIRCTRCGHEVGGWTFYAPVTGASVDHEPVEPSDAVASEEWAHRTSLRLTLEDLRATTVYVAADSPRHPRYAGHGASEVSVSHGDDLTITTTVDGGAGGAPGRDALRRAVRGDEPWPSLSAAAASLAIDAQDRATERAVARAEAFTHQVEVGRAAVPFDGLRSGPGWSLVGQVDGAVVVISGRGLLPRRLRRVEDPVHELVGR